jgi:ribosomal protein S5
VNVTACPIVEGFELDTSATEVTFSTFCEIAKEVAATNEESPPYDAVIECVPGDKADVEKVAAPELTVLVPITTAPSRNCTLPVAVDGVTAALKVTVWPTEDGLGFEVSDSDGIALITSVIAGEVDPALLESPAYVAVIECVPCVNAVVEKIAEPELIVLVPITTVSSRYCTLPVAVDGVMATEKVTVCPTVDGFALAVSVSEEVALITWAIAGDVDPTVVESPPYTAVMECVPCVKADVEKAVGEPIVLVPITAPPSRNCTLPVAVDGVTVTVKVTVWPSVAGFALDVSVSEEAALITWPIAGEVDPNTCESPLYAAMMECVPGVKAEVEKVAAPELTVLVPIAVPPSRNVTLPVAVDGLTVAVNVTACPAVAGLALDPRATEEEAIFTV